LNARRFQEHADFVRSEYEKNVDYVFDLNGQMAKDEIEITLGLRYRHDLKTEDGTMVRGWRNLAVVKAEAGEVKNASKVSGQTKSSLVPASPTA
jgi:hypothetical protein